MYREGQTATNPKTGERVVFQGGQWVRASGPTQKPNLANQLTPQDREALVNTRAAAEKAGSTARMARRFGDLNEDVGTGPWANVKPLGFVGPTLGNIFGSPNPKYQEMQSITARLTPEQRVPGSGATSDFDAQMFRDSLPSVDKLGDTNAALIKEREGAWTRASARAAFMDRWAERLGTLSGAEAAFSKFWNDYSQKGGKSPSGAAPAAPGKAFKGRYGTVYED